MAQHYSQADACPAIMSGGRRGIIRHAGTVVAINMKVTEGEDGGRADSVSAQ